MKKEFIKIAVKEAIIELMATDDGKIAFGPVIFDAVAQWLRSYEYDIEKHGRDGSIEVVKERGDILVYIAQWIKNSEGAIRGAQIDAAAARNNCTNVRKFLAYLIERYGDQATRRTFENMDAIDAMLIDADTQQSGGE